MRLVFCLTPVLVLAAGLLTGCGYAGEPKPPALKRPGKATNLDVAERGDKIIVTFTLPLQTTEGLRIDGPPDVELRVGVAPDTWNQAEWEKNSDRIAVPAGPWPAPPPKAPRTKKLAKPTTTAKAAKQAKQTTAAAKASDQALLLRTVDVDSAKYANKTVVVGVRVHGPSGHDDGWSRLISLEVKPVLPMPRDLRAANARDAVHLQWTADAPAFRVFRRQYDSKPPADADWVQIGDSTQPSFDDKAIDYGKAVQYRVESVRKTGEIWQESDPSATISWTPKDEFPPAVPMGLATISGTRSIELDWDRVADSDVAGYRVYRNGVKVAEGLQTPSFSDKDVVAGSKYSYQVSAVDQAGNESAKSVAADATME
jgi:hypothetical protein